MAYMQINHQKKVFITGAAGFIGYHLCIRLIELGYELICLDNQIITMMLILKRKNKVTKNKSKRAKILLSFMK